MSGSGGRAIEIDRERCMGSGNRLSVPHTFDLDDELRAVVIDPAGDNAEKVGLAIEGCPIQAIRLSDG